MPGAQAPDFAAKDLDGQIHVLSSLKDNPVVVRFMETNCRFCKADTPIFNKYYEKYHEAGLRIIYVGAFYEQRTAIDSFIEELGVQFPVIMDGDARLADLYDVKVYPQTFMIGPDGVVLATLFGGVGDAEFEELLVGYLAN